jgi:hypothetical protein
MDGAEWLPGARTRILRFTFAGLVLVAAIVVSVAAPRTAAAATISVACGDVAGLKAAINAAAPGDTISLAGGGCNYAIAAADNSSASGANGLPLINKALTIEGNKATISRASASQFRFFEMLASANLTLSRVTLSNGSLNGAPGTTVGGAIFNRQGILIIKDSTLSGNQAPVGGAIYNSGPVSITGTTFVGNSSGNEVGGAIYQSFDTLNVTNSSFFNNSAFSGSAIVTATTVNVLNSTFSGNDAVSGLQGGALYNIPSGTLNLQNSVVSNNTGGNCTTAAFGGAPVTDGGHNITWPDTTCPGLNEDPKLGPLAKDGGPTYTFALQPGSPAVDAIPPAGAGCPPIDQRGVSRPQGPSCDIGAFELTMAGPTPTPASSSVPAPPATGKSAEPDARWLAAALVVPVAGLTLLGVSTRARRRRRFQ